MAQLDDYNTPTRQRHLAGPASHRYRFSWLRIRWECICGKPVCYSANVAWTRRQRGKR